MSDVSTIAAAVPASYAEADGDLQTLRSHGLGAAGVHVSGPSDIEELS
jgi:hypothetical protein